MKDINLLPDDMKSSHGANAKLDELRDKVDPKMILFGIAMVLAAIVVFFMPLLYNSYLQKRLDLTQAEINSAKYEPVRQERNAIAQETANINMKKNVITEIDNKNLSVGEIFSAINGILPEGCSVSKLMYDGRSINIGGTVSEDIQIGEIITRAKRLNFFTVDSNANISYDDRKNFNFTFNVAGE